MIVLCGAYHFPINRFNRKIVEMPGENEKCIKHIIGRIRNMKLLYDFSLVSSSVCSSLGLCNTKRIQVTEHLKSFVSYS